MGAFNGPKELSDRLLESGKLERCVAEQYLGYVAGRRIAPGEAPIVDALHQAFSEQGYDFRQMMLDYAASEQFGYRREPGM